MMVFKNIFIPYGCYWSTPFCSWQGSFQNLHAIKFAADIGKRFVQENSISLKDFDELILGTTIPQLSSFSFSIWANIVVGVKVSSPRVLYNS